MFRTEPDVWWLNVYVVLSRAIRLGNLMLFNAPQTKAEWDNLAPPSDLRQALERLEV